MQRSNPKRHPGSRIRARSRSLSPLQKQTLQSIGHSHQGQGLSTGWEDLQSTESAAQIPKLKRQRPYGALQTAARETSGVCASKKHLQHLEPPLSYAPHPTLAERKLLAQLPALRKLRQFSLCVRLAERTLLHIPILGSQHGFDAKLLAHPVRNQNPLPRSRPSVTFALRAKYNNKQRKRPRQQQNKQPKARVEPDAARTHRCCSTVSLSGSSAPHTLHCSPTALLSVFMPAANSPSLLNSSL